MAKANQFFTQRGKVTKEIVYKGENITVVLNIPTNKEHDEMMEKFTEATELGTNVKAAEMIEERLILNIIDLSFEVPKTEDVNGDYINWSDATEDEKRCAISTMDSKLRELINGKIIGESQNSEDEQGN